MRTLLWSVLCGGAVVIAVAGPARAQAPAPGSGMTTGPDAVFTYGSTEFRTPTPIFFAPFLGGQSQGYGYYPAMYWRGPGAPLNFNMYTDGSVSSPYRTGSTVFLPNIGYTAWGDGPYNIPLRPLPYLPYSHQFGY
jgi:hypothetical protein